MADNMATEQSMFALLRTRYPEDAYVLLPQVRNATGSYGERTADAILMSLWPSRGFEIKCSRSDWVREKDEPAKADKIACYCDRFWLVISDEKIVQDGELPVTWGLIVLKGEKLFVKTKAPKLEPKNLDRGFVASLLRQAQKGIVPLASIQAKMEEARKNGEEDANRRLGGRKFDYERLTKMVKEFQDKSGVEIDHWNVGKIGEAVRLVLEQGSIRIFEQHIGDMTRMKNALAQQVEMLTTTIEAANRENAANVCEKIN